MPTAARPLSARPSRARISSTPCQLGMIAVPRVNSAAQTSAVTITRLRPMASERGPRISRPMARVMVETDSTRLLCAALSA
ncbi:hypothetical protein D9M68_274320 [compost metagenome]